MNSAVVDKLSNEVRVVFMSTCVKNDCKSGILLQHKQEYSRSRLVQFSFNILI